MPFKSPEVQREYQRKWIAKRREEFFADKDCSKCGSMTNLELHHLDPAIKEDNSIWSWSKVRREAELAKCIVLCNKCHNGVHAAIHGSIAMYNHHGCRCAPCRDAKRIWRSKLKATGVSYRV